MKTSLILSLLLPFFSCAKLDIPGKSKKVVHNDVTHVNEDVHVPTGHSELIRTRDKNEDAEWSLPIPACIWGHNVEVVNNVTLQECQERCDLTTRFVCRSLEYVESSDFADRTCWMSNVTSQDTEDFQSPCEGVFSSLLFSEKLEGSGVLANGNTNTTTATEVTGWTCEVCDKASSVLISHSTSTSSMKAETLALVDNICPADDSRSACALSLRTFWTTVGTLIWSGFWSNICLDKKCPLESGTWTEPTSSYLGCEECRARINGHLDYLDSPTALNQFLGGLHKFCHSQDHVEECKSTGEEIIPNAASFIKMQPREWINQMCEEKLDCKKDY